MVACPIDLNQARQLLTTFKFLIDEPLVNFYRDNHWRYIVTLGWDDFLVALSDEELSQLPCPSIVPITAPGSYREFLKHVENCIIPVTYHSSGGTNDDDLVKVGMSPKKQHEISEMSSLVMRQLEGQSISQVIDFGSGKGYLPENLSLNNPQLLVVGLDKSEVNTRGALNRNNLMNRLWYPLHLKANPGSTINRDELNHYEPLMLHLNPTHVNKNFVGDISAVSTTLRSDRSAMLVGLHACGDLTSFLLSTFLACPELRSIVSVGCCYHLITQRTPTQCYMTPDSDSPHHYPNPDPTARHAYPLSNTLKESPVYFSRNALNLAQQAPEKNTYFRKLPDRNIFYRAVFQVILSTFYPNAAFQNVGHKASAANDFLEYCNLALEKLSLPALLEDEVMGILRTYEPVERHIYIVYQLRMLLSRVIESVVVVDRLCYLRENGIKSEVGCVFDPVISPRTYVITGEKP